MVTLENVRCRTLCDVLSTSNPRHIGMTFVCDNESQTATFTLPARTEIDGKQYYSIAVSYAGTEIPARLADGEYYVSILDLERFSPNVSISENPESQTIIIAYSSSSSFHSYGFSLSANMATGTISGTAHKSVRESMRSSTDLTYFSDSLPYVSVACFERILTASGLRENYEWELPPQIQPPPIDRIRADRATIRTWDDEQIGRAMISWISVPIWKIDGTGEKISSSASIGVHKELVQQVTQIFQEIYSHSSKFPIQEIVGWRWLRDPDFWTQSAIDAAISNGESHGNLGDARYRNHPSGTAIDINWPWNPIGAPRIEGIFKLNEYEIVVQTFKKYGWSWGGEWDKYQDWMHFSLLGG